MLYYNNMLSFDIRSQLIRLADRMGVIVSLSCGIHCAAMTAIFILYPALWLNHSLWESGLWPNLLRLEKLFLLVAWLMALLSMTAALFRHRRYGPPILALSGLGLLTVAITTPVHYKPFVASTLALIGGLMLATAHGWNLVVDRKRANRPARAAKPKLVNS